MSDDLGWELMTGVGDGLHAPILLPPSTIRVTKPAEVRTEEGKLHLFVAIDRTSKYAFAQLPAKADRPTACAFLEALIAACPYLPHTVLTDNGVQFAELPKNRQAPTARWRVNRF